MLREKNGMRKRREGKRRGGGGGRGRGGEGEKRVQGRWVEEKKGWVEYTVQYLLARGGVSIVIQVVWVSLPRTPTTSTLIFSIQNTTLPLASLRPKVFKRLPRRDRQQRTCQIAESSLCVQFLVFSDILTLHRGN